MSTCSVTRQLAILALLRERIERAKDKEYALPHLCAHLRVLRNTGLIDGDEHVFFLGRIKYSLRGQAYLTHTHAANWPEGVPNCPFALRLWWIDTTAEALRRNTPSMLPM